MKIVIDTDTSRLSVEGSDFSSLPLYSDAAFQVLSDLWIKVGWNQKYSYGFSWLGRPIIQLPADLERVQ
jgi:cephalosporin hydroxylase